MVKKILYESRGESLLANSLIANPSTRRSLHWLLFEYFALCKCCIWSLCSMEELVVLLCREKDSHLMAFYYSRWSLCDPCLFVWLLLRWCSLKYSCIPALEMHLLKHVFPVLFSWPNTKCFKIVNTFVQTELDGTCQNTNQIIWIIYELYI